MDKASSGSKKNTAQHGGNRTQISKGKSVKAMQKLQKQKQPKHSKKPKLKSVVFKVPNTETLAINKPVELLQNNQEKVTTRVLEGCRLLYKAKVALDAVCLEGKSKRKHEVWSGSFDFKDVSQLKNWLALNIDTTIAGNCFGHVLSFKLSTKLFEE